MQYLTGTDQFVAEKNIQLFRRKLRTCATAEERRLLGELLDFERRKLHGIAARGGSPTADAGDRRRASETR